MAESGERLPAEMMSDGASVVEAGPLRVLNLVTNPGAPPYEQQVASLRRLDVEEDTLGVPGERQLTDDGLSSRSVSDYVRFYPRVLRRSFDDYDLVHANYGLTGPAAIAQPTLPVVLSLWGSDLFGSVGPVSRVCARLADAVIVMSQQMADALDVDCHVIPHGVDIDLFRPIPQDEAREEVGWTGDGAHVLFPYGPGRPEKDLPRARRVVGAARRRVDGEVTLHTLDSIVPHDRMPFYMNAADVMILTSRWEGSPNTVKEAIACNVPVVSTDVGDVRERLDGVEPSFVRRTDEGLVDALVQVIERCERSNGREAARPLGLQRMGEQIRAVYDSVV